MIIDLIIDRKCGVPYSPETFYRRVFDYMDVFPELSGPITMAMDYGTENDVKNALCGYVTDAGYNPKINDYINAVNWL